jgi:allene oxide cyclase
VFTSKLEDQNSTRVGTLIGRCMVAAPASLPTECEATAVFNDGTLSVAGVSGNSRTTRVALTGGTGAYEGARGSVTSVSRSNADNAPSDDTVHILG